MRNLVAQIRRAKRSSNLLLSLGTDDIQVKRLVEANPLYLTAFVLTCQAFFRASLSTEPYTFLNAVARALRGGGSSPKQISAPEAALELAIKTELERAVGALVKLQVGAVSPELRETLMKLHLDVI
jgi:hypothetical protein